MSPRRAIMLSATLFVAAALILPWVGPFVVSPSRVWHRASPDYEILLQLRLSRTLLALVAGAALSLAGTVFQAMLRDALAEPYTLGISAGASLGAVVTIVLGWGSVLALPATSAGALAGASLVLLLLFGASRYATRRSAVSSFTLLLAGIAVNSMCAALILILSSFAGVLPSFSIARWLIGSVDSVGFVPLVLLAGIVAASSAWIYRDARGWNLLAIGEAWAMTRGVRPARLQATGLIAGAFLVAGPIAFTGPIGFLGLVVPHLVRTRISADHRVLMPCAFFLGGTLLAVCDALARSLLPAAEIPVGAVLALLGGPALVWIIRGRVSATR